MEKITFDGGVAVEFACDLTFKDALALEFAGGEDEELHGALAPLEDEREIIAAIVRSAIHDEMIAGALRKRIDEMRERLARFETRRERKREVVLVALERLGLSKLVEADFTAHLRAGPPLLTVTDEAAIPPDYFVMREPELNRQALTKALKAGLRVPGALIEPGQTTLAVRRS